MIEKKMHFSIDLWSYLRDPRDRRCLETEVPDGRRRAGS